MAHWNEVRLLPHVASVCGFESSRILFQDIWLLILLSFSGFHWHHKYLSRAEFVSEATTVDRFPLVVGDSGVPYVLGDEDLRASGQGLNILGEVFLVSDFRYLDEYEGVHKGYYERRLIQVTTTKDGQPTGNMSAYIYVLRESEKDQDEFDRQKLRVAPRVPEYTKAMHQQLYRPIRHILVKQNKYLAMQSEESSWLVNGSEFFSCSSMKLFHLFDWILFNKYAFDLSAFLFFRL